MFFYKLTRGELCILRMLFLLILLSCSFCSPRMIPHIHVLISTSRKLERDPLYIPDSLHTPQLSTYIPDSSPVICPLELQTARVSLESQLHLFNLRSLLGCVWVFPHYSATWKNFLKQQAGKIRWLTLFIFFLLWVLHFLAWSIVSFALL